ncbi:phosphonate C-P lyase system protein PhnG [Escherichia coli]
MRAAETGVVQIRRGWAAPANAFLPATPPTRAAVRLTDGTLGYSWVLGRDKQHAERCALIDALMQQSRYFKTYQKPFLPRWTLTVWHALPHARPK